MRTAVGGPPPSPLTSPWPTMHGQSRLLNYKFLNFTQSSADLGGQVKKEEERKIERDLIESGSFCHSASF